MVNTQLQIEELHQRINRFHGAVDDGCDTQAQFFNAGQIVKILLRDMGFSSTGFVSFSGEENTNQTQIIQHISLVNVALTRIHRSSPGQPKRPIGLTPW